MTVHIESPLGFTADFPEFTQAFPESAAGPNTEQYGLLGGVLVTVIKDDNAVQDAPQATGWAHLMSAYYLDERGGTRLAEGSLDLPGKDSYAVMVGFQEPDGTAKVASAVGVFENGRFIGVVVVWPVVDAGKEPQADRLKDIVGAISLG
ncbi:hypothetical protein [Arthrobacter cupressi]|uniref:Uncharacterized protein n=1 Tax=Arthrobacter cupressi TaxID=1045773 RepID=A0A1G8LRC5_9MICC|nr:hypothetical protein [Arthrobacter cupressi]NYD77553.1 hypothetical protein [Arthrobacter cupressi]SDI57750.1 hypothetical protein SAMN05216555_103138 [Arthrobacter cupressi]